MELIERFKYLPKEIVNNIIEYTEKIVYRNGKYISRLNKTDPRHKLIMSIPRPVYIGRYKILLRLLTSNVHGYFIEYNVREDLTKINIRFICREKDGVDSHYNILTNKTYIFDVNDKWSQIINYLI